MTRTGRNLLILIAGFVVGGVLSGLLQRFLPDSAAKSFFTAAWTPTIGPFSMDILVISFTLGPVGLHVSLLSLLGVVIAYLIARSLF
jgi:uncharacterized protein DUF4321